MTNYIINRGSLKRLYAIYLAHYKLKMSDCSFVDFMDELAVKGVD